VLRVGAMVVAAAGLAAGCSTSTDLTAGQRSTNLSDVGVVGVIAGSDGGWVVAASGSGSAALYRWTSDGLRRTASVPVFRSPILTSLGGTKFVGGVRCAGTGCDRWVAELVRFDQRGTRLGVVTIDGGAGRPDDTTSIALVGRYRNELVVLSDRGLTAVGADGATRRLSTGSPPGMVCAFGDDVFAVTMPDMRTGQPLVLPPAGTVTTFRATIERLVGSSTWEPAAGGDVSLDLPAPATATCGPASIEVRSGDITYGAWTPTSGLQPVPPATGTPDAAFTPSSTGRTYGLLADGTLVERGVSPGATGLRFAPSDVAAPPSRLAVDDSSGHLFACVTPSSALGASSTSTSTSCQAS
jgi:hypothetical protein